MVPLRLISPIRSGVWWKMARQPYQLRRLWRLATRPPTRTSARSLIWSPRGSARSAAAERGLNELRIRRAVPQGTGLREQEPDRARPAAANTALLHVQQATANQLLAGLKEAARSECGPCGGGRETGPRELVSVGEARQRPPRSSADSSSQARPSPPVLVQGEAVPVALVGAARSLPSDGISGALFAVHAGVVSRHGSSSRRDAGLPER